MATKKYLSTDEVNELINLLRKTTEDIGVSKNKPPEPDTDPSTTREERIKALHGKLMRDGLPIPDFPIDGLTEKQIRDKIIRQQKKKPPHPEHYVGFILGAVLVAAMLLVALLDMPYGYYRLLRLCVTGYAIFFVFANLAEETIRWPATILMAIIALTFNPVMPVYLDRETWAGIDVAAAAIIPLCSMLGVKRIQ